jgi:glutamine amidotransferase
VLEEGLPFLGICVGLQILFERSEEGGATCLGWLAGEVARFPPGVRVPQIGWNRVAFSPTEPLGAGVAGGYFYFVNSYYARPAEPVTAGETEYGVRFASVVRKGNVAATQFHLEKSGETGLRVLKNFAEGIVC